MNKQDIIGELDPDMIQCIFCKKYFSRLDPLEGRLDNECTRCNENWVLYHTNHLSKRDK